MLVIEFYQTDEVFVGRVSLDHSLTVGRSINNDILLSDLSVSREHAKLLVTMEGDQRCVSVVDKGSANGTYVNDRLIRANVLSPVKPGDQIRMGIYRGLVLEKDKSTAATDGTHETLAPHPNLDFIPLERLRLLYRFTSGAVRYEVPDLVEQAIATIRSCVAFDTLALLLEPPTGRPIRQSWTGQGATLDGLGPEDRSTIELCVEGHNIVYGTGGASLGVGQTINLSSRSNLICVPLHDAARCFGALCVRSSEATYDFEDVQLVLLVASTIAKSIGVRCSQPVAKAPVEKVAADTTGVIDYDPASFRDDNFVQQRAEALIAARDSADAANRAKSEFLANISHELRTPLHGILSFATFGIENHSTSEREKLLGYFEKIYQSGETLLALLNDLLDLARLEAGKMAFEYHLSDVNLLLAEVAQEFSSRLQEKELNLSLEGLKCSQQIRLDPDKIKMVVRNLLSNAIKFCSPGRRVRVEVFQDADRLQLSVHDQGIGIPEDELEAIFDKFVQSRKTKSGAGGTGLGLAICNMIVAAHNGRIWARNNSDGGASFTLELPMMSSEVMIDQSVHGKEVGLEGCNIL